MQTPLYKGHDQPRKPQKNLNSHKGLWFERFFNQYDRDWAVGDTVKKSWIDTVAGKCGDSHKLQTHALSQSQLCKSLQGETTIFKNNWHFVTGMGNNHPVENGMSWHSTLGTPYLTGASVKGLVRSWLEEWSDIEEEKRKEKLHHWFGSDHKDPKKQQQETQTGSLIFFDALPVDTVTLACDIMTPHMGDWYSKGNKISKDNDATYAKTLPADWHNPIPIPFLIVKQASLQFSIAPRPHSNISPAEIQEAMQMLTMALEYLGAGAKTATGYGRFNKDDDAHTKLENTQKQAAREKMKPEDRFTDELKDIDEKKLAEMFGSQFNKTKASYEKNGCDFDEIIRILITQKQNTIESWSNETKNTAKNKWSAYKKIKAFENEMNTKE